MDDTRVPALVAQIDNLIGELGVYRAERDDYARRLAATDDAYRLLSIERDEARAERDRLRHENEAISHALLATKQALLDVEASHDRLRARLDRATAALKDARVVFRSMGAGAAYRGETGLAELCAEWGAAIDAALADAADQEDPG